MANMLILSTKEGKMPVLSLVEYDTVNGELQVKRVIKSREPTNTEILLYRIGMSDQITV